MLHIIRGGGKYTLLDGLIHVTNSHKLSPWFHHTSICGIVGKSLDVFLRWFSHV